jgi:hypothetical protein
MDALIVRKITQPKNARLGRLLVSFVKELRTTLLSVTFTPMYKKLPSIGKKPSGKV